MGGRRGRGGTRSDENARRGVRRVTSREGQREARGSRVNGVSRGG